MPDRVYVLFYHILSSTFQHGQALCPLFQLAAPRLGWSSRSSVDCGLRCLFCSYMLPRGLDWYILAGLHDQILLSRMLP